MLMNNFESGALPEQQSLAREELFIAEGSDWNWWYGPEHHSANDGDFDRLYRRHLANVYSALGQNPPLSLAVPIAGTTPSHPAAEDVPAPDPNSVTVSHFALFDGAMHQGQRRLAAMHADINEHFMCARLQFVGERIPSDGKCRFEIEIVDSRGTVIKGLRVETSLEAGCITDSRIFPPPEDQAAHSALLRAGTLELRLKSALLPVTAGCSARMRFALSENSLPVDSVPREGWMRIPMFGQEPLRYVAGHHQ